MVGPWPRLAIAKVVAVIITELALVIPRAHVGCRCVLRSVGILSRVGKNSIHSVDMRKLGSFFKSLGHLFFTFP